MFREFRIFFFILSFVLVFFVLSGSSAVFRELRIFFFVFVFFLSIFSCFWTAVLLLFCFDVFVFNS